MIEPSFELASAEGRARMERLGYVRALPAALERLGHPARLVEPWPLNMNPLNPAALIVVDKPGSRPDVAPPFMSPISGRALVSRDHCWFCPDDGHAFPMIDGIRASRWKVVSWQTSSASSKQHPRTIVALIGAKLSMGNYIPLYYGSSFSYIAAVATVMNVMEPGIAFGAVAKPETIAVVQAGFIATGIINILVGLLIRVTGGKEGLDKILPPIITGSVACVIGIGLGYTALTMASGTCCGVDPPKLPRRNTHLVVSRSRNLPGCCSLLCLSAG